MNPDQNAICLFLRSWPGQFVSRREICRRAGGKWRFREDENWAAPVLQRMVEDRVIETDDTGHFRLIIQKSTDSKNKRRMWLSPAIRSALKQGGRNFEVIDLDKEPEPADSLTSTVASPGYHPDSQVKR